MTLLRFGAKGEFSPETNASLLWIHTEAVKRQVWSEASYDSTL